VLAKSSNTCIIQESIQRKANEMAKSKLKYAEIHNVIREFSDASQTKYNSYAYAAGYLESQLALVLADVSISKQNEIMNLFQRTINDLKKA
jgi:hypothetical protein